MIKPQDKKSKGNKNRRISDMNKYGYNFDWQENRGYEEIEALNKKTIAAGEVNLGECLTKKLRKKNSNHNSVNKFSASKVFALRAARGFIK